MRRERRKVTGVEHGRAVHAPACGRRRPRCGCAGPVLHARGAGPPAAPADERLPRGGRRAGLPDRPDRPGDAGPVRARARGGAVRARPARQRLRPRRRAAAARRRRDRDRAAAVPLAQRPRRAPPAILGFRTEWHAEAAALVPNAEVCIEPTYVTELLPDDAGDVLACGPEPMLAALRARVPDAQLAWEAPMACGYGACYGCAVEIEGELKRLCVDGPVLRAA